jgi:hypothetical protein
MLRLLNPGVMSSGQARAEGGEDRGATVLNSSRGASAGAASAAETDATDDDDAYFSADDDDLDDDGDRDAISKIVTTHPILDAVKAAVKTLPRVEGQTRVGKLDLRQWPDYVFRLPLPTLHNTAQASSAYVLRKVTVREEAGQQEPRGASLLLGDQTGGARGERP